MSAAPSPPVPFIVGMGRSGTTLLRLMLDSHSELAIPPETNFAAALDAFEGGGAAAAVDAVVASPFWNDYNMSAQELAWRVEQRNPANVAEVLRTFFELYAELRGKSRWGNKTPYLLLNMDDVEEMIPEARFVHIVRDGRDVALSTIPLWFGPNDVATAARKWSDGLTSARRQAERLSSYTEIRFEELVRDPRPILETLCNFLELKWEPAILDYHLQAHERLSEELGDVFEAGRHVSVEERLQIWHLVDRPLQPDRIARWRREMSATDVLAFEEVAGEALEAFGYELSRTQTLGLARSVTPNR
jgi:sulfotransferase family protein